MPPASLTHRPTGASPHVDESDADGGRTGVPDLSREGPFDVHQDRPHSGASPRLLDGMQGCQFRMTSYDEEHSGPDFTPAYGVQLHDPRLLEYVGAPEWARLLSHSPEYWVHHISLLCTVSKIFTKILNNRLLTWAEENNKLDEGQSAYRKGRSTIDNLFTLNALGQKYLSRRGGRLYCVFVDFSRAFDSIPHAHLWYRLINIGIHGKTLRVLRSMYSKLKLKCVKTNSGLTELFECLLGTRQGCMISPLLFILYIDELVNMLAACGTPGIFVNDSVSSLRR